MCTSIQISRKLVLKDSIVNTLSVIIVSGHELAPQSITMITWSNYGHNLWVHGNFQYLQVAHDAL